MGGHEKGEVASAITSEAIAHYWMINEEQDDTTRKLMAAIEVAVGKMGALDVDAVAQLLHAGSEGEAMFRRRSLVLIDELQHALPQLDFSAERHHFGA